MSAYVDRPILNSQPSATQAQMRAYLTSRNPTIGAAEVADIVLAYWRWGVVYGIDPAGAFAQACLVGFRLTRLVQPYMFHLRHHRQILRAVIAPLAVDMMNDFGRLQQSPQHRFRNKAVLRYIAFRVGKGVGGREQIDVATRGGSSLRRRRFLSPAFDTGTAARTEARSFGTIETGHIWSLALLTDFLHFPAAPMHRERATIGGKRTRRRAKLLPMIFGGEWLMAIQARNCVDHGRLLSRFLRSQGEGGQETAHSGSVISAALSHKEVYHERD